MIDQEALLKAPPATRILLQIAERIVTQEPQAFVSTYVGLCDILTMAVHAPEWTRGLYELLNKETAAGANMNVDRLREIDAGMAREWTQAYPLPGA